ncbi:MAG: ankyrin repeat domain-containing protein [Deltaproteobacteria bacterium]|nr:ankyrin repeat domain-containing protein [Deltaproteobacteria bacterium]
MIGCVLASASHAQGLTPEQARAKLEKRWTFDADSFVKVAQDGHLDGVELFLAAGMSVDAQDRSKQRSTALLGSIARIKPAVATYLLSRGADPNLANADGVSPLSLAIRASMLEGPRAGYPELIDELIAKGADLRARDKIGFTPLMEATAIGNGNVAASLLTSKVPIDERTTDGRTALFIASSTQPRLGAAYLELGADPNATTPTGRTPLMEAVEHGWLEVVKPALMDFYPEYIRMLVDRGANVNAVDQRGMTALAHAAAHGDLSTATLLLERGATPTQRAFDAAIENQRGAVMTALIDAGYSLSGTQRAQYLASRLARRLASLFPVLVLLAIGGLWFYSRRVLSRPLPAKRDAAHGDKLPRLAPLICANCGGGVPIKLDRMACPSCGTPKETPADYKETLSTRAAAADQLQAAVSQWRRARRFTSLPVLVVAWSVGFIWLAVTTIGLFNPIGRAVFDGHPFLFVFGLLGAFGLPVFSVSYASYLTTTRRRLPVIPTIGAHVAKPETTECPTCGGAISYEGGQLVTSCGYCGTETYRVELARRSRDVARADHAKAALSLHDAMVEVSKRRRELFGNLALMPLILPVLLYMLPVATVIVIALMALVGRC